MARIFKNGLPNFPTNEIELQRRLEEVEKLINNDDDVPTVNIKFVEAAFQLMQDYGLITESNINFLLDSEACRNFKPRDPKDRNFRADFYFMRNPSEGALRHVYDYDDVKDAKGAQRFYSGWDRRVELNGETYLFSNDWYADHSSCPNKRAFHFWLKEKAEDAWKDANKYHGVASCYNSRDLTANEAANSTIPVSKKPDDLKAVLVSLNDLHKKFDDLNEKLDKLNSSFKAVANKLNEKTETLQENLQKQVEDINKEVKALYELWK